MVERMQSHIGALSRRGEPSGGQPTKTAEFDIERLDYVAYSHTVIREAIRPLYEVARKDSLVHEELCAQVFLEGFLEESAGFAVRLDHPMSVKLPF